MKSALFTTGLLCSVAAVVAQECPPNIGTDPNEPPFGTPIPMVPEDIPSGCSKYEIFAARGTSENGKFGYRVGDPLIGNVTQVLEDSRGYPVQYPASFDFQDGVLEGGRDVAARIESQSALCPDQSFSLVGYSQGAMVMRSAFKELPEELFEKIKSVVLFGDPELGDELPASLEGKVLENCAPGDSVCDRSGFACPYSHISYTYPEWMELSKDFIVSAFLA